MDKRIEELEAENERLTAVYEAADRICNKPIYSKADEDRLRKALAAVEMYLHKKHVTREAT